MSEYIEKEVGIVSPVPVGAWSNATAYKILNIVNNVGSTYIAKLANQGIEPGVASNWQTYWMLLAERGVGIQSTSIDEETGNLIITYTDGVVVDAGNVVPVEEFAELKREMEQAISDAETATGSANDAATLAETKAGLADGAATLATEKAGLADDAATLANQKAQLASDAAELADTKAALADQKATLAQEAAEDAQAKAILAEDAATNANQAAEEARSIAPSKLDKQSYESTRKQAYTKDKDGQQSMTDLDTGSNAATIPVRDADGTFHVGTPSQSTHPATKGYVDTQDALNEKVANKVTIIDNNSTDTQYPSAKAVNDKIKALPVPMQYKGTLGVGGTIQTLPEPAEDNNGFEYKVITAGTYAGQTAKVGDVFISNGTVWDLIPSGDEPSGTVTNVNIEGDGGIETSGSPITTSGTIKVKNTGVRGVSTGATDGTIKVNTNGTETEVPVAGLQSGAFIDADTKVNKVSVATEEDQVYAKDADGTQKMINVPDITAEVETEIKGIENGSIEVSQAKSARAINPLTEDSGTTQENPFISQGTGTNNNSESVDTTPVARQLEKQGNTVPVMQLVKNGNFSNGTTNWLTDTTASISVLNGVATVTNTTATDGIKQDIRTYANSYYFISFKAKSADSVTITARGKYQSNLGSTFTLTPSFRKYYYAGKTNASGSGTQIFFYCNSANGAFDITDIVVFHITSWDSDIITDLTSHPEHFSWYYNGSLAYDAGSLQNCNGRYLVCTGRQLWDEQTLTGYYDSNGTFNSSSGQLCTKNKIFVVPNTPVYLYINGLSRSFDICEYDASGNFLRRRTTGLPSTKIHDVSADAWFINVNFSTNYGGTYNHNITISKYYTPEQGGEGYNQHYPYVEPKTYDTGSEVLRSAGNVKDIKKPDGTIIRNVGSYTFTGEETWSVIGNGNGYNATITLGAKYDINTLSLISTVGNPTSYNLIYGGDSSNGIAISGTDRIAIGNDLYTNRANLTGKTIYFELANPTTEQGTPFDANIDIDDYGMMYWLDTNGNLVDIPQGVKIQYPPAYVETLDTLVTYTNGDVTSLAKKSYVNDAVSGKLDKASDTSTYDQVYGKSPGGTQQMTNIAVNTIAYALIQRDANGRAKIADPSADADIVNKSYVDSRTQIANTTTDLDYVMED